MKNFLTIFILYICFTAQAEPLLPADNALCVAYCADGSITTACADNKNLHMTLDGRCGCLADNQFSTPHMCLHGTKKCPSPTELVHLYRYIIFAGQLRVAYTGCACYPP